MSVPALRRRRRAAALALLVPVIAAAQGAGPPEVGCTAAQSRQFDFWVGRWQVFRRVDPEHPVAESVIENLYGGCAIRENWLPRRGAAGGSLSAWVGGDPGWRQTWVDASGAWVEFRGGWNGRAMVLQGRWPQPGQPAQITRMTYTVEADGAVRQLGESSDDGGGSWQASFDFVYRPVPP